MAVIIKRSSDVQRFISSNFDISEHPFFNYHLMAQG